ncbi:MAG: EI24 domain-containing protein [Ferrovibrio sp.]|uniref:EI24 domain-containing protein n=1 Tax=Ferrovibrio sp. TaxID=1917215 RepID=UPI0026349D6D|nr:EI24 domain-containing protein [Ferrovibrio sp.]MCW0234113.1 EI24 domain-containing protein [Ferrovibrio sp.]
MIAPALRRALAQLPDPTFRRVLIKSLLVSLVVFVLLGIGLWAGLLVVPQTGYGWLDWVIGALSSLGFLLGMMLLFPAVMTASIGLFLDDIADAVEARYYQADPPGRPLATLPAVWSALRFLGIVLVVNIALLPLYAILLFFPPLLYGLSLLVNGWLVGREYFEAVAFRYQPRAEADLLRRRRRGDVWLCGVLIVLLLTIPLVNFLVPIVATAFMVHVYKRLRATG